MSTKGKGQLAVLSVTLSRVGLGRAPHSHLRKILAATLKGYLGRKGHRIRDQIVKEKFSPGYAFHLCSLSFIRLTL